MKSLVAITSFLKTIREAIKTIIAQIILFLDAYNTLSSAVTSKILGLKAKKRIAETAGKKAFMTLMILVE